jgi:hypothetical protein
MAEAVQIGRTIVASRPLCDILDGLRRCVVCLCDLEEARPGRPIGSMPARNSSALVGRGRHRGHKTECLEMASEGLMNGLRRFHAGGGDAPFIEIAALRARTGRRRAFRGRSLARESRKGVDLALPRGDMQAASPYAVGWKTKRVTSSPHLIGRTFAR